MSELYPPAAPDTVVHFGPYAYPIARIIKDAGTETAATEHLNVSAYPPCVLYREPCNESVLRLETVFAMLDELVSAVEARNTDHNSVNRNGGGLPFRFVTTSIWIDRLHHVIVKLIWKRSDVRLNSVPMWEHLALRLKVANLLEMSTLIRGRRCTTGAMNLPTNNCITVLVDDYRYERASLTSDTSRWYRITSSLRAVGQIYIWIRILCLVVGCYKARAAESNWVPVCCYALAHFIDCSMIYLVNERVWTTLRGFVEFKPSEFLTVAVIQMRNIWFVALFLKFVVVVHHQLFGLRIKRWTPENGIVRIRGVVIGGMSVLTICGPLRVKSFRNVDVTSFKELSEWISIRNDPSFEYANTSENGFPFDLKLLALAFILVTVTVQALRLVGLACGVRIVTNCKSYLVPFSASTLWPRESLLTANFGSGLESWGQIVQGCPRHDSLMHFEQRTTEHWSIVRLMNIAMMTDPLVLLRLYLVGRELYIYRLAAMARNEEKAQSLLNRWTTMKQDFSDTFKNRRPYLASQCDNLKDAERWRRQIIREISKKIADIQNAGSSEHVVRDLNDEINKRMREKRHWERRIVELGGPDYYRTQPQTYDAAGSAVKGAGGYKYFGAARNLPGVRELFEKEARAPKKRSRHDMLKNIEPAYFGLDDADEDDEALVREEAALEATLQQAAIDEWNRAESERAAQVAALQNVTLQS
ncbi:hypothetical protein PybrP1_004870 [[Pythium] brassicae (nom. inval.)]|nr:hypothetical protein PybrP1_004870 [[Pythium] brassicae (nom. inval.)]